MASRILWLSGCEIGFNRLGKVDTMRRYIYIHGTPDSEPMAALPPAVLTVTLRIVSSIRGRGRVLTSGTTLGRGRGGFRPIRGRVGRPDGLRTMGTLRKRILATSSVRSREFVRLKTSKMRR